MSGDVRIIWDNDLSEGDLILDDTKDLQSDDGLTTSVLISLFTNRRAKVNDILINEGQRNGWWGDLINPIDDNDRIGSRLYLLGREKTIDDALKRAKIYTEEALEWLIEDKVASIINVLTERINSDILAINVRIYRKNGKTKDLQFEYKWRNQFNI